MSTVPIWLRGTKEYIGEESQRQIRLFSSQKSDAFLDDYDFKFNKEISQKSVVKKEGEKIGEEIISKSQLYSSEIEKELSQIEAEWKTKLKLSETNKPSDSKSSIFKRSKVNEKASLIPSEILAQQENNETKKISNINFYQEPFTNYIENNKKFIDSTQIHQKPKELIHMKRIFNIKNSTEKKTSLEDLNIYVNSENHVNQLFYIEYIIERLRDLLTRKSKEYLKERQKSKLQEEREREEKLDRFEKYVSKKSVWFSGLETSEANSRSTYHVKKEEEDDGEAEMKAKIESITGFSEESKSEPEKSEETESSECKKPLPDFKKLREQSKLEQLKIKECFFKMPSKKSKEKIKESLKDEEESNDEEKDNDPYDDTFVVKVKETNEEIVRFLPTVDSQSQLNIRRKFFFEKLIK